MGMTGMTAPTPKKRMNWENGSNPKELLVLLESSVVLLIQLIVDIGECDVGLIVGSVGGVGSCTTTTYSPLWKMKCLLRLSFVRMNIMNYCMRQDRLDKTHQIECR